MWRNRSARPDTGELPSTGSFDLVFLNGSVFTGDPARPWARALAVRDDRIAAVGTDPDGIGGIDGTTHVVDLAGRMLLPGFQDAHTHPIHGGLALLTCDLLPCGGPDEALERIRSYASTLPREAWVKGRGWAFEWFEGGRPSASLLDRVTGGRPAYLVVRDGHSAWVNHRALELAGITADTPDPAGGRIERNPDGSPQGTLHEGAMDLVERAVPPDTPEELDRALKAGLEYLLSCGVTAICDAWVTPDYHRAYVRAADRGGLPIPVRGALWWDRDRDEDQLEELRAMRSEGSSRYRPEAVKLMLDGVCENFTASLLEPYAGKETRGVDFIDPDRLPHIVRLLDADGFQCHFHAIGDAAVRWALDAVETARAVNGFSDLRHTIAHLQVVHPDDVPRFRRLGVVANCQPLWACNDRAMTELTIPFLGPERARRQYPFGSLRRSGAVLAMGSDWPVSTADVMQQVAVAVRRLPVDDATVEPFLPEEAITLADALTAFSAGSAYVNHLGGETGTLRVGNVANLVVLNRNPFEVEDPSRVEVDLTVVAGDIVYQR